MGALDREASLEPRLLICRELEKLRILSQVVEERRARDIYVWNDLAGPIVRGNPTVLINLIAPAHDTLVALLIAKFVFINVAFIDILRQLFSEFADALLRWIAIVLGAEVHIGCDLRREVTCMNDGE